jgi:hypothetical protein
MNDDAFTIGFFVALLALAVFGAMFLVMDFRHFRDVATQCEKQGFIQNNTTRIQCRVEKP